MPKHLLPLLFSLFSQLALGNQTVAENPLSPETTPPIVTLHSPDFNTPVTAPVAVNITVEDAALTEWRLSVRTAGDANEGQYISSSTSKRAC